MLLTRELLSVFGKEFSDGAYFLLSVLAAGYAISTPFVSINFALVTAYERTTQTMGAYACGAFAAVLMFAAFGPSLQLEGIALAFILLQVLRLFISMWLINRYCPTPIPVRAHLVTLAVVLFGAVGAYYFGDVSVVNTLAKVALFAVFFVAVIATKIMTIKELREVLTVILPQQR
jgi:O-antigen/teichoic acid export membrane protein